MTPNRNCLYDVFNAQSGNAFIVERNLQRPMCTVYGRLYMLLADEPLSDQLVDGRLDTAGRHPLAVPLKINVIEGSPRC